MNRIGIPGRKNISKNTQEKGKKVLSILGRKDSIWSLFFVGVLFTWMAVLTSSISSQIYRKPLLIDTDLDLSIFTVPFLSFNMIFFASTF